MVNNDTLRIFRLIAVLLLPNFCLGQTSGQPATRPALTPVPKGYFTALGTSLNIKPVLSEDDAYDAIIGSEGGTMVAEGPDLNVYTLTIPPGALAEPTEITMTPLKSVGGLPFARGLVAGVHLAPSGTWFMRPARLSIRPPQRLPAAEVTPFEYAGQGENMYLTPYRTEGDRVVVFLDHFSGQGLTLSTPQERALELARAPLGVRERLSQRTAEAISELSRRPPSDQGEGFLDAIQLTEEAYRREVLDPIRQQCAKNCTMGALYLQLTLAMERQRQLLGAGETPNNLKEAMALDAAYVERCLKEQYEQCLRTGDYRGIEMWYLGYHRQLQITSGTASAADALEGKVNEYITSCAQYEVEFDSTLLMTAKLDAGSIGMVGVGPINNSYAAALKAKVPARFAKGTTPLIFTGASPDARRDPAGISGFGPLEYTRYELDGSGSSALALFQDSQGAAHGYSNVCTFKGVSTKPGVLTILRVEPGFKNAEDRKYPLVADTDTSEMAQAIRILRQLPQVGLLAPPRLPDPKATTVWVAPQEAVEVERQTCKLSTGAAETNDQQATTWLDQWQRWRRPRPVPGPDGNVLAGADGAPVTGSELVGEGWSSLTDADVRWHDSNTERSQFGTILIEATAILRHTPKPVTP